MCGIHGIVVGDKVIKGASGFLSDAFVAGSLRGKDSSGIAVVDLDSRETMWQKLPVQGSFFVEDKYAQNLMDTADGTNIMAICHTRAATVGKVGINEAHPFLVEDDKRQLIGVHNGTLSTWKSEKGARNFDVDSEWGLNHIFTHGEEAFKDFRGAYAFVWWDSANVNTLNIALNDQRPMYIAFIEGGGMAYASEVGMLFWLLSRNNLKIDGSALKLMADYWYQFDINSLKNFTKKEIKKPVYGAVNTYNYTGRTYRSEVDKVSEVFANIDKQKQKEEKKSPLTKDEVLNVQGLMMQGAKGWFCPTEVKGTELIGTFYTNDNPATEWSATIRNAAKLKFDEATFWEVTAIGATDDGTNIDIICSKPRIKLASTPTVAH